MLFADNFVHCDMHAGNLLVAPRGGARFSAAAVAAGDFDLVVLDAGLVVELAPADRRNFVDLFAAVVRRDGDAAGQLLLDRARRETCPDRAAFKADVARILRTAAASGLTLDELRVADRVRSRRCPGLGSITGTEVEGTLVSRGSRGDREDPSNRPVPTKLLESEFDSSDTEALEDISGASDRRPASAQVADLLLDVLSVCRRHRVCLEANFATTVVAITIVEGIGRQLDPDLDLLYEMAPFVAAAAVSSAAR